MKKLDKVFEKIEQFIWGDILPKEVE